MSQLKIRGQEVTVQVAVDGVTMTGFAKVESFTETPLVENVRKPYLGQAVSEVDQQSDGWDTRFSINIFDASSAKFSQDLAARLENSERPPKITLTASFVFRDGDAQNVVRVYKEGVLRPANTNVSDKKSYVVEEYEGAFRKRDLQYV